VGHRHGAIDHNFGRIMNPNIAEYHVPVNADMHDIEVIFVDEPDDIINPLGIKGLGEIGIVGSRRDSQRDLSRDRQTRARFADHTRQAAALIRVQRQPRYVDEPGGTFDILLQSGRSSWRHRR
jgi:hypothetical protein